MPFIAETVCRAHTFTNDHGVKVPSRALFQNLQASMPFVPAMVAQQFGAGGSKHEVEHVKRIGAARFREGPPKLFLGSPKGIRVA